MNPPMTLINTDPLVAHLIERERARQFETISLIASENYANAAICEASGSVFTNKYAEGTVGKRFYAGCEVVDELEQLAIDRCKKLFNCEYANVQPHSGSQANSAAYLAFLNLGDTVLAMDFAAGGHLTHGYPINLSGKLFKFVFYTVDRATECIDYDAVEKCALEHRPKLIIAGASAYSRTIDFERFGQIAKKVGAFLMADIAHIAGLIAAGCHPSPIGHADCITSTTQKTLRGPRGGFILSQAQYATAINRAVMPGMQGGPLMQQIAAKAVCFELAHQPAFKVYQTQVVANAQFMAKSLESLGYRIVAGGTDNHLFMVDLTNKGITGADAEIRLSQIGITVNRNCIPFDTQSPMVGSGIRIGTAALTTRGMRENEVLKLTGIIHDALSQSPKKSVAILASEVKKLACSFSPF
ncbi:MAG: Serine hydroxymethyltransferase [candidate division TM6 bacterium GW2011_GWF2_43_87]|nr:MAG: Serine hydroxymethyltransferase [candidate division TM6 bacterium GW2011_GWF2_43_87]